MGGANTRQEATVWPQAGGLPGHFFTPERRLWQSREDHQCEMENKTRKPAGGVVQADVGSEETVYF